MTDIPPQNLEAEESVLGAMLSSRHAITAVSDIVRPEDFYRMTHAEIYKAALALDARGEPVDAITLSDELDKRGNLSNVGGKVRIASLAAMVPATANAGQYAKIVRETAMRRNLIEAGNEITRLGWEGNGEIGEIFDLAERKMSAATDTTASKEAFTPLAADLTALADKIITASEEGRELFGVKTGLPTLDAVTTGLHPGEMIVVAARPSMGKSVLGQTIATNVADRGRAAAILSLEMTNAELATRWLAKLTKLDTNMIRRAKLTPEDRLAVRQAEQTIQQRPLFAEDDASLTMAEIRARVRRLARRQALAGTPLELLIVDYLQLMVSGKDPESRQQEVAGLSRSLKLLAKELHIPVIAISQLSRALEARENKRPMLSDLRDSGAIEQDADIVLFLYRESAYKQVDADKENDTELIVAKNRMGETKTVNLLFLKKRQMFTEPARGE
jgi:replicative DNA helicase